VPTGLAQRHQRIRRHCRGGATIGHRHSPFREGPPHATPVPRVRPVG
jgi:hypothetical protein